MIVRKNVFRKYPSRKREKNHIYRVKDTLGCVSFLSFSSDEKAYDYFFKYGSRMYIVEFTKLK